MGKVFSWEQLKAGEIPKEENFNVVRSEIISGLEKCDEVVGGVICGSVLRGDSNIRSDLDCFVLHTGKNMLKTFGLFQELDAFAKNIYIPVEFIPVDMQIAHTPTVELSFGIHLDWSAEKGGYIKRNPIPMLSFEDDMKGELKDYIRKKLSKLSKGWTKYPSASIEKRFHFLQKILEAPVYIARKIIRWQGVDISFDDSKRRIVEIYLNNFNGRSSEIFKKAVATDHLYTEKLLQQIACPNQYAYNNVLAELEKIVPDVLEFIRLAIIFVNEKQ